MTDEDISEPIDLNDELPDEDMAPDTDEELPEVVEDEIPPEGR